MDKLTIKLVPEFKTDSLKINYDKEASILEVSNHTPNDNWKYGFNINGSLVIDLSRKGKFLNMDLLIPKSMWNITQFSIHNPFRNKNYDLYFDYKKYNNTLSSNLSVHYNRFCNQLFIVFVENIESLNAFKTKSISKNGSILINDKNELGAIVLLY